MIHLALHESTELIALIVTQSSSTLSDLGPKELDEPSQYNFLTSIKRLNSSIVNKESQYDFVEARRIYARIFGPILPFLRSVDHIIIVPERELTIIPFPALVSQVPDSPASAKWLIEKFAFSLIPAERSLFALRSPRRREVQGHTKFLGLADPIVRSTVGQCAWYSAYGSQQVSSGSCPVYETLDQVTALSPVFGPSNSKIISGEALTYDALSEALSEPVHVVEFATHGLDAEESAREFGTREPALLLSRQPGAPAGSEWLTTTKIESLSMDADIVILSACNTIASEAGGEALSGFARAFFEAGARGVVVSNWYIDPLRTRAFLHEIAVGLKLQQSKPTPDLLREAMLARIKLDSAPRNWAMFTFVGG
jgi:CHAT domain-containing protein